MKEGSESRDGVGGRVDGGDRGKMVDKASQFKPCLNHDQLWSLLQSPKRTR